MPTFDARAAKLLKPGEHLTLDEAPGLRLEASERIKSWIYRYKSPLGNHGMKQVKIGPWPAISYPSAMGEWSDLKAMRDAGRCPASERKAARAAGASRAVSRVVTVSDVCDQYLAHVGARRKEKGAKEVRRMFATMIAPELAARPAAEVDRGVAFALVNSYAESAPVQAKKLRSELGAAWDWAIDAGALPQDIGNWWRQVLRGKIKSKGRTIHGKRRGVTKTVLTSAQMGEVIRFLPNMSTSTRDILTLYIWTCCRGSEIVAMEGREVTKETDGWWWTIPKQKIKIGDHPDAPDHRVPLVGRALEVALRRKEWIGDGYLFPPINKNAKGPHMEQKVIGVAVYYHRPDNESRKEQERPRWTVPHFGPHDLRRTGRTKLAEIGCPDRVAEAIIGHLPEGVEGTYNRHTYDKERRQWLTALSEHWEQVSTR